MTKKSGFTLAEVLITLGIIGVVAAMTIPTLIANTNSAKFKAQFKKSVSTLSQAALMAQSQYDVNFANLTGEGQPTDRLSDGKYSLAGLLNNTLAGVTVSGTKPSADYPQFGKGYGMLYAYMPDGSVLIFHSYVYGCTTSTNPGYVSGYNCGAYIDVNGAAGPNKVVGTGASYQSSVPPQYLITTPEYVPNTADLMTDIYPVVLHDGIVEPASAYAKYVLTSK